MLGWTLVHRAPAGVVVIPTCSRHSRAPRTRAWLRMDVERAEDWAPVRSAPPDALIYCAGICDVKRCNDNPEFARAINVGGIVNLLAATPATTRLVVCTSDHVFSGDRGPYTESSEPDPISVYGQTRVTGERRVLSARADALVVRVGLPIGPSLRGRVGHWDWLRYRHARELPMTVVDGERRAVVWAHDAAERIFALADSQTRGIRHLAATKTTGRPELAAALCRRQGIDPRYEIVRRSSLPAPHLGDVDLRTEFADPLARPLPAVV